MAWLHLCARIGARILLLALPVLCCVVAPCPAPAGANELFCGLSLVLPGDSRREVQRKCGPPSRRLRPDGRPLAAPRPGRRQREGRGGGVEIWVYDRGPRQLERIVTMVGGRVARIEVGGYGR